MIKPLMTFSFKGFLPRNRYVIFLSGIIIISIIAGIFLSFGFGISKRDYFLQNSEGTIAIVQPGVKSPIVSYVPSSFIDALQKIEGIEYISPEIMSLVIKDNIPMTLHGVTEKFLNFKEYNSVSGSNFDSLFSSEENVIVAGKNIAKANNLKVGEKYLLYSTISESFASFILLGTVNFDSYLDDEIFTTLSSSSFFRKEYQKNDYSLIRLKYDKNIISKDQIENLLFSEYSVKIRPILSDDPNLPLEGITIYVYSFDGRLIDEEVTSKLGFADFKLHIGDYRFYLEYKGQYVEKNITIISNMEERLEIDFFVHDLQVRAFYDGIQIDKALISIVSYDGNEIANNNSLNFNLYDLHEGIYYIYSYYKDRYEFETIKLTEDMIINISFNSPLKIVAKSPKGLNINNYNCTITNVESKESETYSPCNDVIFLSSGFYNLTVENSALGSMTKGMTVNSTLETITEEVILGTTKTEFTFKDDLGNFLKNFSVEFAEYTSKNYETAGLTNDNGKITINNIANKKIIIKLFNSSFNSEFYYLPLLDSQKEIIVVSENNIKINVFNNRGEIVKSDTNISILIELKNGQHIESTLNEQNSTEITINGEQILNITVISEKQIKNIVVSSYDEKQIDFYLGNISLDLQTLSLANYPLSNVNVTVFGLDFYQKYNTEICGCLNIELPTSDIGTEFFDFYQVKLYDEEQIIRIPYFKIAGGASDQNEPNLFYEYFFGITIDWQGWNRSFYIPKTYLSNFYDLKLYIPYYIESNLFISDFFGQSIENALIFLHNTDDTNAKKIFGITDNQGHTTFSKLIPGNYEITIEISGYEYKTKSLFNSSNVIEVTLPVVSGNLNRNFVNWNLQVFSGIQFKEQFLGQSVEFIFQISLILIIIVTIILSFLINSSINYLVSESEREISILKMLGASKKQILFNQVLKFQQYSIAGSIIGLLIGSAAIKQYSELNMINLIGFTIEPVFSVETIVLGIVIVNLIIFSLLVSKISKINFIENSIEILK